ncbi:MAG: hypothetical protein CENE_03289 [Candidatus Celerinatantimonas neptuna]|nr:MAG: hypothetical protein CENE_03289 [Candidatus Celerinatantimonas neptuna]
MQLTRILQPLERAEFQVEGQFVYLRSATAPVDVNINDQAAITLGQYDQLHDTHIKRLVVTNTSSSLNPVVLEMGYGQFVPAKNGHVAITNFPTLQTVSVNNWPSQQTVSVSNWKSVQAVKQSGDWQVSVSNQPPRPSAMNSGQITIASGAGSLSANTKRITLIIKAGASNSQAVSIGSYPLEKGEVITLSNPAELALTGTDGDQVFYLEETQA